MIGMALTSLWAATGASALAVLSPKTEDRLPHLPMAAILGPLWIPVALERQTTDVEPTAIKQGATDEG